MQAAYGGRHHAGWHLAQVHASVYIDGDYHSPKKLQDKT